MLAGKLIGVGAVGLTQIAIWLAAAVASELGLAAALMTGDIEIQFTWMEGCSFPVYFVLGFLLYSAFFAGLAATCETEQELQMYMPLAAAAHLAQLCADSAVLSTIPSSFWAIAASLFPPTAPLVMCLRMASEMPPLWQLRFRSRCWC